jgi:hypothetical protein
MISMAHTDGAVVAPGRRRDRERAPVVCQWPAVAPGLEAPFALPPRHEAHTVDAIAVVEPVHLDAAIAIGKDGGEMHVGKRIAVVRFLEGRLKKAPLFN